MASTVSITLNDQWAPILNGGRNLAIQHRTQGSLEIYIGDEAPQPSDSGIVIATNMVGLPSHFSVGALPEGVEVYARSMGGASILVMSY